MEDAIRKQGRCHAWKSPTGRHSCHDFAPIVPRANGISKFEGPESQAMPTLVAVAATPVARVVAPVIMAAAVVVGQTIGEQADGGRADERGPRLNDLSRATVGIVRGGATDAEGEHEAGENEAMESLFHGP